eukprot:464815_1
MTATPCHMSTLNTRIHASESLPLTPVLSPRQVLSNSLTATPQKTSAVLVSPILLPKSLQMSSIASSLPRSLPLHPNNGYLAGLQTPVVTLSNRNAKISSSDYKSAYPVDFASSTLLTFIMSPRSTIQDIINVLSDRGVHIVDHSTCLIYTKPAYILQGTEIESTNSHSLHFDFDTTDNSSSCDVASAYCISLKSGLSTTLASYVDCKNSSINTNTNEYSLEVHFERSQWQTNLEIAIQNEDIKNITNIVQNLKIPFWKFEQIAETVGYFGTPSNHYAKHIKGYIIQSIDSAIRLDKVLCLQAVFNATNMIQQLQNDTEFSIDRSRTINCLSYYFGKSLHYQSRKCIKFLLGLWLAFVGEPLEQSGIFQRYIKSLLKQLYYTKFKVTRAAKRDLFKDMNKGAKGNVESKYNINLSFIQWISSTIEPSLLDGDVFMCTNNDDLFYSHSIGRQIRYNYIKETSTKTLSGDLSGIILDYDGYSNGKSPQILV